ncbi:MAG: hypothetical protein GXX10_01715 [Clostridiaceae bacterium]|nr:hypothetical protein [Clostridiaceae bacterium]
MDRFERLKKRVWEEIAKDESCDLAELATHYIPMLEGRYDQAIELLKEFAFVDIDESLKDRCDMATKVQEFLRKTGYGEWLDAEIKNNLEQTT